MLVWSVRSIAVSYMLGIAHVIMAHFVSGDKAIMVQKFHQRVHLLLYPKSHLSYILYWYEFSRMAFALRVESGLLETLIMPTCPCNIDEQLFTVFGCSASCFDLRNRSKSSDWQSF